MSLNFLNNPEVENITQLQQQTTTNRNAFKNKQTEKEKLARLWVTSKIISKYCLCHFLFWVVWFCSPNEFLKQFRNLMCVHQRNKIVHLSLRSRGQWAFLLKKIYKAYTQKYFVNNFRDPQLISNHCSSDQHAILLF